MEFSQPNLNMLKKKIIIIHAHLYTGVKTCTAACMHIF